MKTMILLRFKHLAAAGVAGAALLSAQVVFGNIAGPYTSDAHTLFLVHFDEPAGSSVATNVGSIGGNFITTTNNNSYNGLAGNLPIVTTLLGYPSYSANGISFTNAVSGTNTDGLADAVIGFDGNGDGNYTADDGSGVSPDAIAMTNLNIGVGAGNSPFTIEALIKPSSITSANQEIVCSDSQSGSRGFQFRINNSGQLEFNFISQSGSDFTAPIPVTGPNAFVAGAWYHVALTYDGTTLRFYWTKMDPTTTAANQIGAVAWTSTTADGAVVAPLIIGGENRGGEQEAFNGLIDEVRISSVARGPGDMQFNSEGVTIVQNPESQNIDNFMPVTFAVSAASTTPLSYQWEFNGTPIPDATNTSYSIASVQDTDAGTYSVVVKNTAGYSATSSSATLVVGAANFLAHRWSFTNDLTDSVGGANGTAIGTATVSGGALVLDGSSNCYVALPAHLLSGLQAVTFDFWATFGTNSGNCRVFDFGNTNSTGGVGILPPQNYLYYTPNDGAGEQTLGIAPGNQQSQVSLTAGSALDSQTVHVTCVVDPPDGFMSIYTNGVLEGTLTNMTVPLSSLNDQLCWIGRSLFTADPYLDANINELRIYSGALSPASVQQSDFLGPNELIYDGPVKLVGEPVDTTTAVGQPVTFSAQAVGHLPITYQWYENGSAIPEATNSSYSFVAIAGQDGDTYQLMATNTVGGTNYSVASSVATLTLTVPESLTWLGANSADWDTTTPNWTKGGSAVPFAQFDSATFDDQGSSQPNVNLTEPIHVTGLTVNSSANYVLGSSAQNGSLSGDAPLIKQGSGKLTLDVANQCTGGTLIQGGTLQIGNNDGVGALNAGTVTNNAILAFDRTNSVTVTNVIEGSGSVQFNGTGSVGISGTNTYTGNTLINNGTVNLANALGLGATSAGTTVANGGTLYITANVDIGQEALTLSGSGPSSGTAGALRKGGAGLTTYYGPISLAGATTLRVDGGATLNLTNSAGISASSPASLTLTGDSGGQGVIVGPLSLGSGASLTVNGATWTVGPNNQYSGPTTLNGGGLRITGLGSLGQAPSSFQQSQISLSGGALEVATNINLNDGRRGIDVSISSTITVDSNATFTVANPMSVANVATLTKTGPGTLVLSAANDFEGYLNIDSGSTTAADGMTVLANNDALNGMFVFPGFPGIFIRNNNSGTSTLGLDGSSGSITVAPEISLAGRNNSTAAIENLTGDNTIAGGIDLQLGGSYVFQSDSGMLTLATNLPYAVTTNATSARTLIFQGSGAITVAKPIQDVNTGVTNVAMDVVKLGTGVLNLPAANAYSGTTVVSNGVLSVAGSIGTNSVTVDGGLLVGTGTINGAVTVTSSGAIEAGTTNTIGTLHLAKALALSGNTKVKINQSTGASDLFQGQSSVTYGGTLTVENLSGTLTTNDSFTLFSPGTSASQFTSIVGSPGPGLAYRFSNGVLSVVKSTVATNPTNITFSVSGTSLTLSWPSDHIGWRLQAQTNTLASGLGTNWVDVAGSSATNKVTVTLHSTNGCVFYRMISP